MTLERPLTIFSLTIDTGALGGQFTALVTVRTIFGAVEFLGGRELFEAQQLKYEDPRRYHVLQDSAIAPGMILLDGFKKFIINSIDRDQHQKTMMTMMVSRRRDLEESSS